MDHFFDGIEYFEENAQELPYDGKYEESTRFEFGHC